MNPFIKLSLRLLFYAVLTTIAYVVIRFDATNQEYSEQSLTEYSQELLLLAVVVLSVWSVRRTPINRAFIVLLGFVSFISFIREFNNTLTEYLFPGAWSTLVAITFVPAIFYFYRRLPQLRNDILVSSNTFGFGILVSGTLLLHVFSRFYGANEIWQFHMGEHFDRGVARVSEESIELMAYLLLLMGTIEVIKHTLDLDADTDKGRRSIGSTVPARLTK